MTVSNNGIKWLSVPRGALALMAVFAVSGGLWWSFAAAGHQWFSQRAMASGQVFLEQEKIGTVVSAGRPLDSKKSPAIIQAPRLQAHVPEPKALAGFASWSPSRQLNAVTELQGNPHLDPQTVAFFVRALSDRQLDEVTRNNVANALLIQEQMPTGIPHLLASMIDDHDESSVWRSYAVQHVAIAYEREQSRFIVDALTGAMNSNCTSVACTAMMQLHRLNRLNQLGQDKLLVLDDSFDQALITAFTAAPLHDPMIAMTTLSILGERGVMAALPIVREALTNPDPHVRRVAVATLGRLGNAGDLSTLEPFLADDHELVVLAARGALQRLKNHAYE